MHDRTKGTARIKPVILCGGTGTRLWPASRAEFPKQFAPLLGRESLYQTTLRRFSGPMFDAPLIVTHEDYRFLATDQAHDIGLADAEIVVEPQARDTAAAVAAAVTLLHARDPETLLLIAPSDHTITDPQAFEDAVASATCAGVDGALVTFGVTPDRAETGYGYLELCDDGPKSGQARRVRAFREKPDAETARIFQHSGQHLWNAGLFLFRARAGMDAFEKHAPDLLAPARDAIHTGANDLGFFRLGAESWDKLRRISFDYAVMEKADTIHAVPLEAGWSDLGAWDAVWLGAPKDADGVSTSGDATAIDCEDSYLRSDVDGIELVGLGLTGIVAVATSDAVLICPKDRAQDVKRAVTELSAAGARQAHEYPRFHRPWGWYERLCLGDRFQVKRIMVKPGGVLSLQSHLHRSEHWVVVQGTAEVTIDDEVKLVSENESVYIPLGTKHRMANHGKVPMYLIEVQTGAYLGEDDIIRHEDVYNRPERV